MSAAFNREKLTVRKAFSRASSSYDEYAQLQQSVAASLLEKMAITSLQGRVLDVGCGTGFLTRQLQAVGGFQQLVALDIAEPMLQQTRQRLLQSVCYVCADAEALPFQEASFDGVFSSLALQWCQRLSVTLGDFRRILKPGGRLVFSTFGAQTLNELKQAWASVDAYQHVNDFYTAQQLQALLLDAEWHEIRSESQVYCREYSSVTALMHELKGLGAQSISTGRKQQLTTKAQMQQMFKAYPASDAGNIIATFEVLRVSARMKL